MKSAKGDISKIATMSDSEIYECIHMEQDSNVACTMELELSERILDKAAVQLQHSDAHPAVKEFIRCLTMTRSTDSRRRAAKLIPCFELLQDAYYQIVDTMYNCTPTSIGLYASHVMRVQLNHIFVNLHGWQR